jgi:N-formylglutamate deformylase
MDFYEITPGSSPIILGFPHTGTFIPDAIRQKLNDTGLGLTDTDWHIHQLYDGLLPAASTVRALFHRYVLDANRSPANESLYPGQNTTGLVPLTDFDGRPIWKPGLEPGETDIAERIAAFHAPYHAALKQEIARVRSEHGVAVVFDCHSIRSRISFLFEGRLPEFNIGTDGGVTCHPEIESAAIDTARSARGYTSVLNGRFKGGWTTRHYADPHNNVHTIQLELAQNTHLVAEAAPFRLDPDKTARLRPVLALMLKRIEAVAHSLSVREKP